MALAYETKPAFATPIITAQLPDAARLNPALQGTILERRRSDPGINRSNTGGWHSDTDLFTWAGEASYELARFVIALVDENTLDTRAAAAGRRGWLLEAWANVAEAGASNVAHSHGGCYWSAVYYVAASEGQGGQLRLHDPRLPALDMHAPDLRFKDVGPEQMITIRPEPGLLVLFPSWLSHSVTPWKGTGYRISIAINLSARPR